MKSFLRKIALFFIPFATLLALYFIWDPFMVLRNHSDYSATTTALNRDYVSTEMFLKNSQKFKYNSFIFGSSRTLAFRPDTWKKHLHSSDRPFAFDASGETIYGIYKKLQFIDHQNINIDNVLLVICQDMTFTSCENYTGHLFIKHPSTSGESELKFHLSFIKTYLKPPFFTSFIPYKLTGRKFPYMRKYIVEPNIYYDTITNAMILKEEELIARDPDSFYSENQGTFYDRKGEKYDTVNQIHTKEISMLEEIKTILTRNKCNYKVIISPLYNQKKFSVDDLNILNTMFEGHLFDYSGENEITNNQRNYYESSHFRPHIGERILNEIYP